MRAFHAFIKCRAAATISPATGAGEYVFENGSAARWQAMRRFRRRGAVDDTGAPTFCVQVRRMRKRRRDDSHDEATTKRIARGDALRARRADFARWGLMRR